MRRFHSWLIVVSLVASGGALAAATATTPADLQNVMQRAGKAQQALAKAIRSTDYAGAQTQTKEMKAALVDAHGFWKATKKADAIKFSTEAQAKVDALDKALAAKNATAITVAQRDVAVACGACHKVYRGVDENNKFIIKPGTI
jgi:cytochrome c556